MSLMPCVAATATQIPLRPWQQRPLQLCSPECPPPPPPHRCRWCHRLLQTRAAARVRAGGLQGLTSRQRRAGWRTAAAAPALAAAAARAPAGSAGSARRDCCDSLGDAQLEAGLSALRCCEHPYPQSRRPARAECALTCQETAPHRRASYPLRHRKPDTHRDGFADPAIQEER